MKILFIGNSFTARNEMPELLAQLATARGVRLTHDLVSAGGASLRAHWNKGDARRMIERTRYDYVVLQEQSTLPIKNARRMHENVRLFDDVIRASGATTALYLTWARRHEAEKQRAITDAYLTIGAELGATVVPVGVAWQNFLRTHDAPVLHDKDNSHPVLAGSYLAACVFFAVFFKSTPVGIASELDGLDNDEVKLLQRAAWNAVRKRG